MVSYADKLKDPRWQRKRLEILERDKWACVKCGATDKTLHVHHRIYVSGRDPWDYDGRFLISLCEECHGSLEEQYRGIGQYLANLFKAGCIWPETIRAATEDLRLGYVPDMLERMRGSILWRELVEPYLCGEQESEEAVKAQYRNILLRALFVASANPTLMDLIIENYIEGVRKPAWESFVNRASVVPNDSESKVGTIR